MFHREIVVNSYTKSRTVKLWETNFELEQRPFPTSLGWDSNSNFNSLVDWIR